VKKGITFLSITLFLTSAFLILISIKFNTSKVSSESNRDFLSHRMVAHALGGIDNQAYTNSLEAFMDNYEKGYRAFEVDLIMTEDGHLVARHDWGEDTAHYLEQNIPANKKDRPLTHAEVMSLRLKKKYTPLDFNDLINLMVQYKDIYIITDTKHTEPAAIEDQFQYIVDHVKQIDEKLLDRIVPQFYNEHMYAIIHKIHPFKTFIYTLYQTQATDEEVIKFCKENNIRIVTMAPYRFTKTFLERLKEINVSVYIHTLNTELELTRYLLYGVHGIYSDYLIPDDIENLPEIAENINIYDIKTLNNIARTLVNEGNFDEASILLDIALDQMSSYAETQYLWAYTLHRNGAYEQALHHYNIAYENGFSEFWVLYNRGAAYMALGDYHNAKLDFEKAYNLDNTHQGVIMNLEIVNQHLK